MLHDLELCEDGDAHLDSRSGCGPSSDSGPLRVVHVANRLSRLRIVAPVHRGDVLPGVPCRQLIICRLNDRRSAQHAISQPREGHVLQNMPCAPADQNMPGLNRLIPGACSQMVSEPIGKPEHTCCHRQMLCNQSESRRQHMSGRRQGLHACIAHLLCIPVVDD